MGINVLQFLINVIQILKKKCLDKFSPLLSPYYLLPLLTLLIGCYHLRFAPKSFDPWQTFPCEQYKSQSIATTLQSIHEHIFSSDSFRECQIVYEIYLYYLTQISKHGPDEPQIRSSNVSEVQCIVIWLFFSYQNHCGKFFAQLKPCLNSFLYYAKKKKKLKIRCLFQVTRPTLH
jgi:hypothetical protein